LDDFYLTTYEKSLQSNRKINPRRSSYDRDSYNEFFSQTNIEEDVEEEEEQTEESKEEWTTSLLMCTGEADMGMDAEIEDNNIRCNYDFNINNFTRGNVLDKVYGPKKTANHS